MTNRISLSEVSRRAPQVLERGDSLSLDEGAAPTLNDLAGALQFALGDGRIWLNDVRMIMMETSTLGDLRAKMIEEIGMDRTRERCMQVGWEQGVKYAELVVKRFKQDSLTAALAAGPRLHTMQGFAKVTTKRFEFDAKKKEYLGEFYWHDSAEGTEHLTKFGVCDCPACWMQVAVPSGYTSTLLGYPVIFREIECVGQGAQRCIVIGKDAASWGDDIPELKTFNIRSDRPAKRVPWQPSKDIELPKHVAHQKDVIGKSAALARARRLIEKVALFSEPVLLLGESGSGKEHFARHLHDHSAVADGPFIPVNCSAFEGASTEEIDTLFGDDGLIAKSRKGSLFLNDVTALPSKLQAKLALMIQGAQSKKPDFRIVSATGQQPLDAVANGTLRADLHYFLSILPVQIPPLRERLDDIPELLDHFLSLHTSRHNKSIAGFTGAVYDMLLRYDYPGNVRELSNLVERGVIYAEQGDRIDISHVFTGIERLPRMSRRVRKDGDIYRPKRPVELGGERTFDEIEAETLRNALRECDWNVSAAARKLGLTRAKLDYRIKKFGLFAEGGDS